MPDEELQRVARGERLEDFGVDGDTGDPAGPITRNQTTITGPNKRPTAAVP